jgi:hypothetical protein
MNTRLRRLAFCSTVAVVVAAALALIGDAQTQRPFTPARLWDGKTPDFRGIWQVRDTAYVNIEGHPAEKGIAAGKSIVVDPPDGKIPYKPQALAQRQENYRKSGDFRSLDQVLSGRCSPRDLSSDSTADSSEPGQLCDCLPGQSRLPRFSSGHPAALRQRGLVDGGHALPMGGRHPGYRRRCADRSSLVRPGRKLSQHGDPHRGTLPDDRRRYDEYEARIEDPLVYSKPWTLRTVLHRIKEPGARIIEDECLEDANGVRHHISPSDPKNLLKSDYSRWKKPAEK